VVSLRALAKKAAYRTGALSAHHALRNAATLTVVMFHRALSKEEMTRCGADPLYTVTPQFLAGCVSFLRKHYNLVGLEDVARSLSRQAPLPKRAALITFDDGWYDNLLYAAAVLKGTPWTVFVSVDATREPECWWQEALLWALRSNAATEEELWRQCGGKSDFQDIDTSHALLLSYARLSRERRTAILNPYVTALSTPSLPRTMLAPSDLTELKRAGADIGAHGASHMPLTLLREDEAELDLRAARDFICDWAGQPAAPAMSFPHGCYNNRVCEIARRLGYPLLFSSDAVLNRCEDGWIGGDLLGRIPIDMHDVADENGDLDPARLATWLFLREIRAPMGAH
jgi:peptidoglycan/xylan/chitin deacetylase (PgdA/CDA1 family)